MQTYSCLHALFLISKQTTNPPEYYQMICTGKTKCTSEKGLFIEKAYKFHPNIKFTAEMLENEITFLDTVVFKGERLKKEAILDIKTYYKPTETFQYTHFNSCHPPGVKNDSLNYVPRFPIVSIC